MTLVTIVVEEPDNPVEIQAWLDSHPEVTSVSKMWSAGKTFYILFI